MSYSIDLFRRQITTERSLVKYATFVAFFPQLVAGPIVRAADFLPQLGSDPSLDWNRVRNGLRLVLWGYVLKCAVADTLATFVDPVFARPDFHNALSLIIGVVFYAFQIYCDFNGYSLIAIGLASMLGYQFNRNFDRPYFASSFSDFWKRWHISLSTWLRDYLYIPLGGNRFGSLRTQVNLSITMLLGGLWHGASWNFVIWGGLHGAYLILQRYCEPVWTRLLRFLGLPQTIACLITTPIIFCLVCFAWIFFRAENLTASTMIVEKILAMENLSFSAVGGKFYVVQGLCLVGLVSCLEWLSFQIDIKEIADAFPVVDVLFCSLCFVALSFFGTFGQSSFIYFQF